MRIELVYARDCPLVAEARGVLRRCLDRLGLQVPVAEVETGLASPAVLVDGVDVMGQPAAPRSSCRLDVPTEARIMRALEGSLARAPHTHPA